MLAHCKPDRGASIATATRSSKRRKSKEQVPKGEVSKTFKPRFLEDLDGRYQVARTLRDRYEAVKRDVNIDSAQKEMLCRRLVFVAARLETLEVQAAETGELDDASYRNLCNVLTSILKQVGIHPSKKDTPDLHEYLKQRSAEKAEAEAKEARWAKRRERRLRYEAEGEGDDEV